MCGHPSSGAPLPHAGSLTACPSGYILSATSGLAVVFWEPLPVKRAPPVRSKARHSGDSLLYRAPAVGWPRCLLSYIIPHLHCCFLKSNHPLPLCDHKSFCNSAPRVLRTRAEQSKSQWWWSHWDTQRWVQRSGPAPYLAATSGPQPTWPETPF